MTTPGPADDLPDAPAGGAGPTTADILLEGEMTVHGRIPGSSNATLLVTCVHRGCELLAVYKPAQGERPLWDFPSGLHRREVGAYVLSEWLGWGLVPDTVERLEGPYGEGSVQRYVPEDGESHYFTLRDDPAWTDTLVTLAAFDVVANNADRKSGHVLLAEERLWAIDNGLCFHVEPKLRTVVWDFGGSPLPPGVVDDLGRLLHDGVPDELAALLDPDEAAALEDRVALLLDEGVLPALREDDGWPPYPWPLV